MWAARARATRKPSPSLTYFRCPSDRLVSDSHFLDLIIDLNITQFFFRVRCFSAATTIFSVPTSPFFCRIFSRMIRAWLYKFWSKPFSSISSSVRGVKKGSSSMIFQVSRSSCALTVPCVLSRISKQKL